MLLPPTATNWVPDQVTPKISFVAVDAMTCGDHVTPSGEVAKTIPGCPPTVPAPAAKNFVPDQVTAFKNKLTGPVVSGREVQVMPSGEVRMIELPTAAHWVLEQVIPLRALAIPEGRGVQVKPSGEVRIVPEAPTEINCVPDQATPYKIMSVPDVREVHVTLVGEVRIVPTLPTATQREVEQATAFKLLDVTESAVTEKLVLEITLPPEVLTVIGPVKMAIEGIVMTICVLDTLTTVASRPLIVTVTTAGKLVPVIVTVAPGAPLVGAKLEIVGVAVPPPS